MSIVDRNEMMTSLINNLHVPEVLEIPLNQIAENFENTMPIQNFEITNHLQHNQPDHDQINTTNTYQQTSNTEQESVGQGNYIVVDEVILNSLVTKVVNLEGEIKSLKRETNENHVKVTEQLDKIYKMLRNENKPDENATDIQISFDFPIENIEDMIKLNNNLKLDNTIKNNLVFII